MRLGMFMMPVHPPDRTFWSTLAEDTEKSLLADQLGFDELWLGEHFSATTEPIPSPLMFLAGLVPHTKNITFGTAVINLPNHHPAIVAAEAAQFDHMSKGRFMLGVGPGGLVSDFELFKHHRSCRAQSHGGRSGGHRSSTSGRRTRPTISRASSGTSSIKDGIMPELGVGFMPKPYQTAAAADLHLAREPEFVLGAHRGAARAGASSRPTSSRPIRWPRTGRSTARPAREAGIAPRGDNWRVARNVMVAPSDAEAHDRVFGEQARTAISTPTCARCCSSVGLLVILKPRPDMPDDEATVEAITERMRDLRLAQDRARQAGGVPRAGRPVRHAADDRARLGRHRTQAWERESMRLLAQEVMPKFRQHVLAHAAE